MNLISYLKVTAVACGIVVVTMVGCMYFSLCPCLNPDLVSKILFHPYKNLVEPNPMLIAVGIHGQEVFLNANGHKVDGWFYRSAGAKSVVLISHGNAGNVCMRLNKVCAMLQLKQSVFLYDYEGFGDSDGKPGPDTCVADACSAYDYLTQKLHYSPKQIIAYGESIGTGVTAELVQRREVGGIILESGFTSPERLGKEKVAYFHLYPSFLWFQPSLNVIAAVSKPHPPLLIIHGQKDTMIPCHHAKDVYDAALEPKRLVILPRGEHNCMAPDVAEYNGALAKFFADREPLLTAHSTP